MMVIRFNAQPNKVQPPPIKPLEGSGSGAGVVGADRLAGLDEALRILNMPVPQVEHLPLMALRPFFSVVSLASAIGFSALHFTQ
jgi:hypothetical protein